MSKVVVANDHGAVELTAKIVDFLKAQGYEVNYLGTAENKSVDYPDMIHPLAKAIENGEYPLGIILCGSGNGAQMTANKHPHVRAALCWNEELAKLARQHNDANILSLPGRFIPFDLAWKMVQTFLSTPFEGGRHARRIEKIEQIGAEA